MDDYIAVDLENPNKKMDSITAIGIYVIHEHEIVDKSYSLINPEDDDFDPFIIELTGITPGMVKDSPTFKEYWPRIEELLRNNVIVGHNITYDLNVISRALARYNMPVPSFEFSCTLRLSRKLLKLPSYKLSNIAKSIGINYNPHRADEDARAAYELYEYLDKNYTIPRNSVKHYANIKLYNQEYDSRLARNINNLYGILRLLNYKTCSSSNQMKMLENWVNDNRQYDEYNLFNEIIYLLNHIISKGNITGADLRKLYKTVTFVSKSDCYTNSDLKVQILEGILTAITCDEKISYDEIDYLKRWLKYNYEIEEQPLYKEVKQIIQYNTEEDFIKKEEDIHEKLQKLNKE